MRNFYLPAVAILAMCVSASSMAQSGVEVLRADLGFGGVYKVGCWVPLRLEIAGGEESITAMIEVKAPDADGVVTSLPTRPLSLTAGKTSSIELLVRVGQLDSPIEVDVRDLDSGKLAARRRFSTLRDVEDGGIPPGEPSTVRMIVEVAPTALGTASKQASGSGEVEFTQDVVGRVTDMSELPRVPLAYEGVDTVIVSTSTRDAWTGMRADDPRIVALVEWVRTGGRLVLSCSDNADLVLGSGGPLAALAPGEYLGTVTVDDLGPVENYSGTNDPFTARGRLQAGIPNFDGTRGDVEVVVSNGAQELPVVIRTRHRLGQVVFAGLDLDRPPVEGWEGREAVVAKLLAYAEDLAPSDDEQNYYYQGPSDLVVALQQQLDKMLEGSGIRTPPFIAIAGLVVLYILLIGPGDYFLVKRVLKKMEWTWVTFPTIVLVTCLAAYWYASYLKGDSLRINQLELVDVDNETGQYRGTLWTHLFSPNPARYSLELEAQSPGGSAAEPDRSAVAWLGRPGGGMGGMGSEARQLLGTAVYGWSPDRESLEGMPVEVWSTKTFVTRWAGDDEVRLESDLSRTLNDLVTGTVSNPLPLDLSRCHLVYRGWDWDLGELPSGGEVEIKPTGIGNTAGAPKKLRNRFRELFNFEVGDGTYWEQQQAVSGLDLRGVAEMMMFYDALGGRGHSRQWNRYEHFVDLSHVMDSDTAVLVGASRNPQSELLRLEQDGNNVKAESMRGEKDQYLVLYRYLLPVGPVPQEDDDS